MTDKFDDDGNLIDDEGNVLKTKEELEKDGDGHQNKGDSLSDEQKALFQSMVDDQLAQMKENMNKMAKERDEARKAAAKLKEEERQREIQAMEEAGKHTEAYEAKIADMQAKMESLEKQNITLTRDQALDKALSNIEGKQFRSPRSREIAFREIQSQLVRNDDGGWVHRSGVSMEDYVKAFSRDEDYEFLFKPPENRGAGAQTKTGFDGTGKKKSVKGMTPQEAIQAAAAGQLGNKTY